jgi:hypothetical protein
MEKFDVMLPEASIIPDTREQLVTLLEQQLQPSSPAFSNMASAIQYENKPKFGPSAISNVHFEVVSYNNSTLTGRLRIRYDMQLTFGCEDLIKDHINQHSYYNLSFRPNERVLRFESDDQEAPSTANEF